MKTFRRAINLTVPWLIFFSLVAALSHATSRQKSEPKTIFHLGPTASKTLDEIHVAEENIQRQWAVVQSQKKALFDGAEVALEAREHCLADKGLYVCTVPEPAKPAKPEKK